MVSNKKMGTRFENDLCKMLAEKGMWARPMFPAPDGSQPFDIMIINKSGELYAIECKDCENDVFDLRRIENNQTISIKNLELNFSMGEKTYFAFKTSKGIFFANASFVIGMYFDKKKLSLAEIIDISIPFEKFIRRIVK